MKKFSEVESQITNICERNEANCKKCSLYVVCMVKNEFDKILEHDYISIEMEEILSDENIWHHD